MSMSMSMTMSISLKMIMMSLLVVSTFISTSTISATTSSSSRSYWFVSSFQFNTIHTLNTLKVRTPSLALNRNTKNNGNMNISNNSNNREQQSQQHVSLLLSLSGLGTYRSRNRSRNGHVRLYTSNNDNDNSNDKMTIESSPSSSSSSTASEYSEYSTTTSSTASTKEKVWNTSIFPSPVEQGKFVPQIYIQTIAAFIGIASGVSVSIFKLSIDAIRQFCYEGFGPGAGSPFYFPSLPSFHIPLFLIPIFGSIVVSLLSLTGNFSPGLRGVVKEVDDDSLLSSSTMKIEKANGDGNENGSISRKRDLLLNPIRKSLAAVVTLGTGNSLGPEGPGVEIGAAVSRFGMMLWPPDLIQNFKQMKMNMKNKKKVGENENESDTTFNENGYGYGGYYGENNGEGSNGLDEVQVSGNGAKEDAERIARNRLLLACGAAAGVSSGFNAPLSGVFFALEVIQASLQPINLPSTSSSGVIPNGDSDSDTAIKTMRPDIELQQQSLSTNQGSVTAILISSVLAALVARGILGNELALMLVTYDIITPLIELPLYILLGVSCGLASVVFTETAKLFKAIFNGDFGPKPVRKAFKKLPAPFLPIIGGLTCGIVGIFYPQILFFGYETLNKLLEDNSLPTGLLLTLLAAKTFTTAICASSGLVGGTLAPSLFLGGMVGASFHNVACDFLTTMSFSESSLASGLLFDLAGVPAYSMVGAASVLAAIFRAPLTASLLMFEITRNYEVLLPLLASAGVASLVSDILESKVEEMK